jgi:FG-GAP-like repeat
MTRHSARKAHILSVVVLIVAILTILLAPTPLAQVPARMTNADQASGESSRVSAPPGAITPARAERMLIPWTDGAGPFPAGRSQTKRHGALPMDSNPLFLPAVAYYSGGSDEGGGVISVAVADVNGDGKPDLAVTNYNSGTVGVLLGNGDGTFQPTVTYNAGGNPSAIAMADVNGDGKPDLVVGIVWRSRMERRPSDRRH